ncbi:MAG: class I SAM-dependent methyltransferase [Actinomycetota bacterium]|jgi:SAM-dependent methyltransferase
MTGSTASTDRPAGDHHGEAPGEPLHGQGSPRGHAHRHSHFDEIAGHYDGAIPAHVMGHYHRKRVAAVRQWAPVGGRVLDVGCGTGALLEKVAAAGFRAYGAEPSAGMLDVLSERRPGLPAAVAQGALPFPDQCFDLVYCVAVLHHVIDPEAVRLTLAEMVRVTRPGGHVLIWDHNPRNPYWPYLMKRVPQDCGDERLVPEAEIVGGLERAGACVVSSAQLGLVPDFAPRSLLGAFAGVEKVVEHLPGVRRLCAHNVVVARRAGARH